MDVFLNEVCLRIGRWALTSKECQNLNLDSVLHNREACLDCGPIKEREDQIIFPPMGSLKYNVNGALKASRVCWAYVEFATILRAKFCSLSLYTSVLKIPKKLR